MQKYLEDTQLAQFKSSIEYEPEQLDRYTVLLRDGETTATIYPIHSASDLPDGLLAFLCDEVNMEIEKGDTCPFFDPMDLESFQNYWFSHFAGVMILGDAPTLEGPKQWEKECLGTFLIKPNFPGRSGHICTSSFVVNAGIRGKGIGKTLADCFLQWAPRLGYTSALFNLVFETNVAMRKILEGSNFKRIGRIKSAAILKGSENPVDSIMYGKELVTNADPTVGAYRFDKIRYYLETGKYPAMADRSEKSRLRSASSHYRLEDGKLMLRDKEVISDPVRQIQICSEYHLLNHHGGINKTTSMVAEKYHWARIKDTVSAAIKGCNDCRDQSRDPTPVRRHTSVRKFSSVIKNKKMLNTQPNNPNARNLIKTRLSSHAVEEIAAQLGRGDDALLSPHDLSSFDDNIMAAVEAAQRSEMRSHASYAEAAASGGSDYAYQQHYDQFEGKDRPQQEIPVDPDVQNYDQKFDENRDEIEIARALIQANEGDSQENDKKTNEEANMFLKE